MHKEMLGGNKHHSDYLQNAWNKYGEDGFRFEIIEECEAIKEVLLEREQYWLDFYQSYIRENGYNICAKAGNTMGRKASEETKKKLRV